jgi:type IV pilus assembly protein PilM
VRLAHDRQAGRITIEAAEHIEYAQHLGQPGADEAALTRAALDCLLARHPIAEAALAVSVPGREVLARFFKTPPVAPAKLDDLVQYEARNQVPFDLEQFVWAYQPLKHAADENRPAEFDVGLLAVKTLFIDRRLAVLAALGLNPDVIQSDAAAWHNWLVYDRPPTGLVGTLDLGGDTANLVISGRDFLWLRNVPFGGDDLTRAIVRELKTPFEKAEPMKRAPAAAARTHRVYEGLEPAIDELALHVERTLKMFFNIHPGLALERLDAVGGGFRLHGLIDRLCRAH